VKDIAREGWGDRRKTTQCMQAMFQLNYPVEPTESPRSPLQTLPTLYDLPSENLEGPGLPDEVVVELFSPGTEAENCLCKCALRKPNSNAC
jgi:hypothetical protein